MVKFASVFASLAGFALMACSPSDASLASEQTAQADPALASEDAPATHPISGLTIIDVTVKVDGKAIIFASELADTPQAQQKGLMFRTELGDLEGMIFPSETPEMRSFWMKNTPLPLDIIYIGPDQRILNIAANTTPYSTESIPSAGPAIAVFEIRGGRSAELGITPGDLVEWEIP